MDDKLESLKAKLGAIHDLNMANSLLGWDQLTKMPGGGAEARGRQMGTLARIMQEQQIDPALGKLIDELLPVGGSLPYEHVDAAVIRVAKRDYDQANRVPPEFVARLYEQIAHSYQVWAEARGKNNFSAVWPELEKNLELSQEYSSFFPEAEHIADPLIDDSDYGMKVSTIRPLFQKLRSELVPLIQAITSQPAADDSCLNQHFPEDNQIAFGESVIRDLGYDFERGRQDKSAHPFTTSFSINDVRITTRVDEDSFGEAFFSTTHEAGHAMYEQGVDLSLEGLHLANGTSAGVHESQSRLWENVVSRSKPFWTHYYPKLQQAFPAQLGNVSLDTFYRAINKVQLSLIRTDADEVTYNIHVMIRFDLEVDLLEGKLAVKDLPEAWNERYHSDLGILPADDRNGCMQDVHWYGGFIGGAFQGYTLGNILSALFYSQALKAHPEIPGQVQNGQFTTLHGWMKENIYRHGRMYTTDELVQRITGAGWTIQPYIQYLKHKYGELYEL